ncbi:AraC family transcriptional regulator [Prauserella marina]|uniref:AraC family transcriptional regulator n=1 Tax=Prauserella marina TaxID=530584 RepID=UPI001FE6497F|nr:helix-turn-helix domain-containing protein [Prauserella marina]
MARWEVVRPRRPSRVPGVSMAGFHDRGAGPVDVRVVPHPAVTLVLEFGDGPLVVDAATGRQQRGSLVAGFTHDAVRVRGENVECVQVRLSPLAAFAVLGVSSAELDHVVVTLDDLWGSAAARVRQRVGEVRSWQDRFALADDILTRRIAEGPSADPEVAFAWSRILGSNGGVRVEELASESGWSRKRLWSRFREQIGLSPKRAARLVRFDHAVHRLAVGADAAMTAVESGYVDQSHLNRDVLAFSGITPATMAGETWLAVDHIAWKDRGKNELS